MVLNKSLPWGYLSEFEAFRYLSSLCQLCLLVKEVVLVNISNPDDFGILIMKLSTEWSGILGSNFTGFPQKDAFWGSNSVILI